MNKLAGRTLLLIVLGGGSVLTVAWAQVPEAKKAPPTRDDPQVFEPPSGSGMMDRDRSPRAMGMGGIGWGGRRGPFAHPMSNQERLESEFLRNAVEKLKSAKSDSEKTSAANELSKVLEKSFQRDLDRRERQISDVEARVKKLRDQIDKRKKAKDEIISLRLKTILNEADGLGFPGAVDQESEANPGSRDQFRRLALPQAFIGDLSTPVSPLDDGPPSTDQAP